MEFIAALRFGAFFRSTRAGSVEVLSRILTHECGMSSEDNAPAEPAAPARRDVLTAISVIQEIEKDAQLLATSVDELIDDLTGTLQSMSSLTVESIKAYSEAVYRSCGQVDASIKALYRLMAKCEEVNKNMGPIYQMAAEIKEMKRLLDLLEAEVNQGM